MTWPERNSFLNVFVICLSLYLFVTIKVRLDFVIYKCLYGNILIFVRLFIVYSLDNLNLKRVPFSSTDNRQREFYHLVVIHVHLTYICVIWLSVKMKKEKKTPKWQIQVHLQNCTDLKKSLNELQFKHIRIFFYLIAKKNPLGTYLAVLIALWNFRVSRRFTNKFAIQLYVF